MPKWMVLGILLIAITGCHSVKPPIQTVKQVNLERFMGNWYVIANIPTFIEKEAYRAMESYRLNDDGTIATTFTFNKGGFDGPKKIYNPKAYVRDRSSNAVWGMQFIWPFKAEYRIVYLNENYTVTVIGRSKRDYLWIMARTPKLTTKEYDRLISFIDTLGYDISKIQKVPQKK